MFKPNNKKMLTVLIAVAMIFSAFAILSFAAQPAYATSSSGTVTYNPTTLGVTSSTGSDLIPTVAFVSGGTFSSGSTVYFYLSTTDSSAGLVSFDPIGSTTLTAASPTSLNQAVTFSSTFTVTPGTYYILASNVEPPLNTLSGLTSFAFPAAATTIVVQTASFEVLNPITSELAIGSSALTAGGTGVAEGTGFDPGATVSITLNYPGGSVLTTATANSFGEFQTTFTVPQLSGTVNSTAFTTVFSHATPYTVVAQETNALSSSFPQGDITSDAPMDIAPTITVTPMDISGAAGSSFSISGTGFPAGGAIALSSSSSPSTSIEIETLSSTTVTSTYHSAVTVSSTGQFSVTVTTASAISTTGPYSILITLTDTAPYISPIYEYFPAVLYVSVPNPQSPGFYFSPVAVSGDYLPVFSPLTAAVFDFPAGVSVSVYLGSTLIGSVTTDSNGFGILPVTTTIPAIPAGTYAATAVDSSQGIVASPTVGVTTPITVTAFWMATDPLGNLLFENEFVPQNGTITVTAYGLAPSSPFYITDGAIGNVAIYGTNVTVAVGSVSPLGFFVPADNGTLKMSYQPYYGYYGITTGTAVPLATTPAMPNYAGLLISGSTPGYLEIGAPTVSVSPSTSAIGASAAITFSNLIYSITLSTTVPYQTFYPGTSGFYNFYIGTTKIVSSGVSVFTSLSSPITFTVPSLASGLYNISVTYVGQPLSDALPVSNTATAMLVASTPGKSTSSGSMVTVPTYSGGLFSGYAIAGYGLIASTTADLVIYNSEGPHTSTFTIGSDGAFLDTTSLSASGSIYSNSAAGTWGIVLTVAPSTATAFEFYSSYKVTATFSPGSEIVPGLFALGEVESSVAFTATGLMPVTNYVIEFNGTVLTSPVTGLPVVYTSTSTGGASGSFTVPIVYVSESVGHSAYPVSIAPLSSPSTPAATVLGLVLWPSTITILPDPQAFPNELVNFVWTPHTEPSFTSSMPIYVTVYLSGSAYQTVLGTFNYVSTAPSSSYITGSFKMPNGMPNTLFAVSFGWSTTSVSGSAVSSGSLLTLSPSTYTGTSEATLKLINGTGASIVSISNASIAHIITSSINSALAIPLSELSANITALHGDIATITTAFGTMTATLQAINATVKSIESGQALIKTDLGTISTTLSSINASIVSLNNNVVTINTTLGKVTTSLSSINATVTSTASGVSSLQGSAVTIITDLGTITGVVTNISNGIATIQTSLGNLTRNVSQIKTSTGKINTISSSLGTTEIFEIVILVLVLITLVLSFLAINAANRVAKKVEEQKKQ
ncbi:MAG: hypothetical protein QXV17_09725 [Candidatus Micrarchaeaceae archaeon]